MGKKRAKSSVPKKGDPDYLTPTQLRNRRKRRAKQQANTSGAVNVVAVDAGNGLRRRPSQPPLDEKCSEKDPSSLYLTDPMKAPLVEAARQYLEPVLHPTNNFRVHVVGPVAGWRTVSKLAVRPATDTTTDGGGDNDKDDDGQSSNGKKVAIGLFLPQSHKLVPVPNCVAHHPSINHAVECITRACHDVGIVPYRENETDDDDGGGGGTGVGRLRYVAINVGRETGGVQITLVWNPSSPLSDDIDSGTLCSKRKLLDDDDAITTTAIDDPDLQNLVNGLISMSVNNDNNADDGISSPTNGDASMKKRRRRGRQEGKSSNRGESKNNDIDWYDDNDSKVIDRDSTHGGGSHLHGQDEERSNKQHTVKYHKKRLNLHSLWINYNHTWTHSNAIFAFDSACWQHVHGPRALIEYLKFDHSFPSPLPFTIPLHFPPNVFRQANLDAFTYIVGRIRERMIRSFVDKNTTSDNISQHDVTTTTTTSVVELYGGVGTIGLHITDLISSLVCSDENPNNAQCFYDTVHALPPDMQSRCVYLQKNAATMIMSELTLLRKCQVLIVDPPRKGLDVEVLNYLCKEGWRNILLVVYVSCGFQAFKRDCDALLKCGKWKVDFAEGYLLFPGSDAIETLAFFVPT